MNVRIKYYRLEKHPKATNKEWNNICNTILNYGPKLIGLDYDWRFINDWWIGVPKDKYQLDLNEWYCTQSFPPYIPKHAIVEEYSEYIYRQTQLSALKDLYNYPAKYRDADKDIRERFDKIHNDRNVNLHKVWIEWKQWLSKMDFIGIADDFFLRTASVFYFTLLMEALRKTMGEPTMNYSDEGLVYDEYGEFIR